MQKATTLRRMAGFGPVLFVLLVTIGCVPSPPSYSGGTASVGGNATPPTTAPTNTPPPTSPPDVTTPPTTVPPVTTPPTTVPPPSAGRKPQAPSSGALVGTWIAPRGTDWTQATQQGLWRQREADAGRRYDIGHSFYSWNLAFPTWRESWHAQNGRIPMVSWNGTNTSAIISGQYDDMIRQRADGMRDLNTPVFLRFFWEMDGAWQLARAENPQNYIAAWRHVHQIFDAEGADNVSWVWAPNAWAWDVGTVNATKWYPGDDVVDWIGSDGYNWAPTRARDPWTSFETIYRNFYAWASTKNKPLMVGEFGAIENDPGQKAQWIDDARTTLKTKYQKIKAVVYYDEYRHEDGTIYDWRLDSTAGTYAAWNNLIDDPYFNQR